MPAGRYVYGSGEELKDQCLASSTPATTKQSCHLLAVLAPEQKEAAKADRCTAECEGTISAIMLCCSQHPGCTFDNEQNKCEAEEKPEPHSQGASHDVEGE